MAKKMKKGSDEEFLFIVRAASNLGDGRQPHIKAYKRLLKIIDKIKSSTAKDGERG